MLFKVACSLFILMLTDSQFWIGAFIEKWQKSGAKLCIFGEGGQGVQRGYEGAGKVLPF